MKRIGEVLDKFNPLEDKFISREFQAYGIYLSESLGDLKRKSLYIKLAKEVPRVVLEEALNFVKAAGGSVRSRPRLFMWRLKEAEAWGKKRAKKKRKKGTV